eukprot:GDKJ01048354.1.p1 GENE.GDKJ01048354.1~~GDKJ01048354.1.p1  ORF type:complete len:310 (+),score=112.82 GDKJ01048354.1:88-1017(+)
MAPKLSKKEKKDVYFKRLTHLINTYTNILIISADNVGSKQVAEVRVALRGKAFVLFGKNTLMRTCLRQMVEEKPELQALIDLIRLNIGLVFCVADANEVRKIILSNRVPSAAKQGLVAPKDVSIFAGPTGLDPGQTNFFQTLGVATKLVKSQIEIVADVHVIKKDTRVTASQAALLNKLSMKPFEFGLEVLSVYNNGETYSAAVLDITDEVIRQKFLKGVSNVAAVSLALNYPTLASLPHLILRAYKNSISMVIESDYTFPQMQKIRDYLKNPSAFASAAPAASAAAPAAAAAAAPVEEEEAPIEFDLF